MSERNLAEEEQRVLAVLYVPALPADEGLGP